MAGNVRQVYIDSPVFTHEDEERYHYVDTEIQDLTTRWTEEEVQLESLINDEASVNRDQHQPSTQKAAEQPRQHVRRNSILRDSLEDDRSDSNEESKSKNSIVIANPSRYEDLTMGDRARHAVQHQASRNGRPEGKGVNSDAEVPRQYYLHDDAEEYEEAKLERQHQRREARRAHVPHLELSHSDDEPSDGEAAFDLEINDGNGSHGNVSRKKDASHGNPRHVNFRDVPRSSNSANDSQLVDSLEVAEYYPRTGGDGGNPNFERSLHADDRDRADGRNQPRVLRNSANSHQSVYRNTETGQRGHHDDVPMQSENYEVRASEKSFTAKSQQLSSRPPPPPSSQVQIPRYVSDSQSQCQSSQKSSNFRMRSDESSKATDFVEANRHNVNRKPQRSYGQMYSRKKGKENTVESDRSIQHRPVDLASVSAPVREEGDTFEALGEQNMLSPSRESEESNIPSAEQLWHARSQSLAARKESAESLPGKNRRGRAGLPQNRVARDARVNNIRPVVPQATSSAPYRHHSDIQQFPAGSFTVPVQSEIPGSSHAQKVSVDINLNVVSPRPLLNQPSTALPIQYTSPPPPEVYHQYSSRTQAYTNQCVNNATGHYPATSFAPTSNVPRPFAVVSQAGNTLQYTNDDGSSCSYAVLPHSQSAAHFASSVHQQPMPHFVDSRGQMIPNQPVPQHLPIRYNYSYPQPVAVPVSDVPLHVVHPYQMQVCNVNFLTVGGFV